MSSLNDRTRGARRMRVAAGREASSTSIWEIISSVSSSSRSAWL